MGIFDNLFKNKEEVVAPKEVVAPVFNKDVSNVVAPVVNKDVSIYDEIKTLIKENEYVEPYTISKLVNMPLDLLILKTKSFDNSLDGVSEEIKIQEKRSDLTNLIVEFPLEYRPLNRLGLSKSENNFLRGEILKNENIEKAKNNQFLVIYDITKEEQIKFNSMLDGFKDKVGKEWLLGFVDFMEEVNKTKSNNLKIKNKNFISSLNLEGNTFKQEPFMEEAYQITKDSRRLYIKGVSLDAWYDTKNINEDKNKNKFNKDDYIVKDKFGRLMNISKEDFEAKYKVIEKESFENIIDETKKVLNDKSNEYNGLKKELESAKVEIERLREKLNGIENNFKSLS